MQICAAIKANLGIPPPNLLEIPAVTTQTEALRPHSLPPRDPKGGRPSQQVAALLAPHILDAAFEEFLDRGFDGANMDRIAATASVTKRTIYARYKSKRELLFAAIEHGVEKHVQSVVISMPHGSIRTRLLHIGREALDLSLKPEIIRLERLLQWVVDHRLRAPQEKLPIVTDSAIAMFRSVLKDADGVQWTEEDIEFLANHLCDVLILAPHNRILIRGNLANSPADKADYFRRALDLIATSLPFGID